MAGVHLPEGLAKKYPKAGQEWPWFWLWPARALSVDPRGGVETTQIYLHVMQKPGLGVKSPLD